MWVLGVLGWCTIIFLETQVRMLRVIRPKWVISVILVYIGVYQYVLTLPLKAYKHRSVLQYLHYNIY